MFTHKPSLEPKTESKLLGVIASFSAYNAACGSVVNAWNYTCTHTFSADNMQQVTGCVQAKAANRGAADAPPASDHRADLESTIVQLHIRTRTHTRTRTQAHTHSNIHKVHEYNAYAITSDVRMTHRIRSWQAAPTHSALSAKWDSAGKNERQQQFLTIHHHQVQTFFKDLIGGSSTPFFELKVHQRTVPTAV